jgi:hypothetical protein
MDNHTELLGELKEFVGQFAPYERTFGPSTALMRYGRDFRPSALRPNWLLTGERKNCFNNATAYAAVRDDVFYAEGYALEPDLPIPVQHAWLVDRAGKVIDPTWDDTKDHVYFGIAFNRAFVMSMVEMNSGEAGLLVNLHLLRRQYRDPIVLESAIRDASVLLPAARVFAQFRAESTKAICRETSV